MHQGKPGNISHDWKLHLKLIDVFAVHSYRTSSGKFSSTISEKSRENIIKKRLWEPIVSRLNNKLKTTTFIEKDFAQKGRFLQNFLKFPRIFHSENLSIAASVKI